MRIEHAPAAIEKTFSATRKIYPTLAAAVTVTAAAPAWTLGSFVDIVPTNTITSNFRIDYVSFAAFSVAGTFEVAFYKGASGSEIEIGRCRVFPQGSATIAVPLFTESIPANSRISAKAATGTTNADTVISSIIYHLE
jgi:hypothetical protein